MPRMDANGVCYTTPIETPRALTHGNGTPPVAAAEDAQAQYDPDLDWNKWAEAHVDVLRREMRGAIPLALAELTRELMAKITPLTKRIAELETGLEMARGALDALRGAGSPNVVREETMDRVGDALGVVRADFDHRLAVQAKRISELELQLAEAVGALNVLRGKGVPGSLNVRGTFDPEKVYSYLDMVAFNGSSWVATRDSPGDLPGPGWQLLASASKRGLRGECGPTGPRGPVGEKGESGLKGEQGERGLRRKLY